MHIYNAFRWHHYSCVHACNDRAYIYIYMYIYMHLFIAYVCLFVFACRERRVGPFLQGRVGAFRGVAAAAANQSPGLQYV